MTKIAQYKTVYDLSYAEYGDPTGFPVLVQHGIIASIRNPGIFQELIQLGARLICIARPGYGDSSAIHMENIAEWGKIVSVLVDQLGLSRFDVLGISSGAPYSYAIGYQLADRVRNLFILSGTPALYDAGVQACWPYPVNRTASLTAMQALANELFFAHLPPAALAQPDIQDSMRNDGFGVALDLMIRCRDWGFQLPDLTPKVYMRHNRADPSVPFVTAQMTAQLLPDCQFEAVESDVHFSPDVLNDFIRTSMASHYRRERLS